MSGSVLMCAILATGAAPVPPVPANQAPAPRLVRPDISLIVVEPVLHGESFPRSRVLRIGFRKGTMLPPETVWEGEMRIVNPEQLHRLVADRYLVTRACGVIDLHDKKVINDETDGQLRYLDEKRLLYYRVDGLRESGVFSFDFATSELTRLGDPPKMKRSAWFEPSPNGKYIIETSRRGNEFLLHRDGENPKSLGKGFQMDVVKKDVDITFPTPMLWLENDRFLTQRGNGKLVTVDLDGKVTALLTIKEPGEWNTFLSRDGSGAIIYSCEAGHFKIDIATKTAVKTEWADLGHGFEARKKDILSSKLRHSSKDIGEKYCLLPDAVSAPGYLAVPVNKEATFSLPRCVGVWSVATGAWTTIDFKWLGRYAIVGWIK